MDDLLFANFLNDEAEYKRSEAIWRERWIALVRDMGQEEAWRTPWLNTGVSYGSFFRDGNPIFSAVSPARHLGVRIIQADPEIYPTHFNTWTDTFAEGEPEAIKELVIHCVLSEQALSAAEVAIKRWLAEGSS